MERTLILGSPDSDWRELLASGEVPSTVIILEPSDWCNGPPSRVVQIENGHQSQWEFVGGIAAPKCANRILSACAKMISGLTSGVSIVAPAYRSSLAVRNLITDLINFVHPNRVILSPELKHVQFPWRVQPEFIQPGSHAGPDIRKALRKAQWLKLIQSAEEHSLPIQGLQFQHSQIGSGQLLEPEDRVRLGLDDHVYGETNGNTLFLVTDQPIDDSKVSRALDITHMHKAQVTLASAYKNLTCAILDRDWRPLGLGLIQEIDFASGQVRLIANAVAPAPVSILQLGHLYVDSSGREIGEARPGEV